MEDQSIINPAVPDGGPGKSAATLQTLLEKIERIIVSTGSDLASEQQRISEIQGRFTKSRFHLAVLGQFKRGKSTFLNALLGERLLPSAVVPLTSVPTFISWSPVRSVKVTYRVNKSEEFHAADSDQAADILSRYVTEEKNPLNRLGVESVEVGHPSPLLRNGVVLIDTPGIGSTFEHNTEATMKFIPQCDAAFFLISADPPITQVEIEFLKSVQSRVVRLFFIMNKIDYLDETEQSEALSFLSKVLTEHIGPTANAPIFSVSARHGLDARMSNNNQLWRQSGMAAIEDHLVNFLVEQKSHTLNLALTRKAQDVVGDALMRLQLQQKSLKIPLEDLEERLGTFQQKLKEAEQKKTAFKDLLEGDKKRTIDFINEQSGDLYRAYFKRLSDEAFRLVDEAGNLGTIEKEARQYISQVVPREFNHELEKTARQIDEHINGIIRSYQNQLIELTETVRRTAADLFEVSYIPSYGEDILEMKHEPFWVTEAWRVNWSPLPENWFEAILPRKTRIRRLKKRLAEDIDAIISHNVGNLRWATVCNITDSFYAFGLELEKQIQRVIESTGGAIAAAHKKRLEQSSSIEPELEKMEDTLKSLSAIKSDLTRFEEMIKI